MTIPFAGLFKKLTGRFGKSVEAAPEPEAMRPPPIEKPSSERLSKTVMPNKARTSGAAPDNFQMAAAAVPNTKLSDFSVRPGTKKLSPAVALALQAQTERAISLQVSDILDEIPAEMLKPRDTIDSSRRLVLKASEIERGMSEKKPAALLGTIYDQVPDIFLNAVTPDCLTEVALPYEKVLEQFQNVQVRDDQEHEQDVPQVETPILKVTMEDTKKFGTALPAIQTSAHPPVKVEPATAKSISKAVPEAVARETAFDPAKKGAIPLSVPVKNPVAPSVPASEQAGATRIAFSLPPNGTGASAPERVPASSGPPVPTSPAPMAKIPAPISLNNPAPKIPAPVSLNSPPVGKTPAPVPLNPPPVAKIPAPVSLNPAVPPKAPATPEAVAPETPATRIPFKTTSPLAPQRTLVPGIVPPKASEEPAAAKAPIPPPPVVSALAPGSVPKSDGRKISLSLSAVMRNLPAFQLNGDVDSVADDAKMELPLSIVESQLAGGRVAVPAKMFVDAMPEAHRTLFAVDVVETPVLLPLQEVLKNLPATALKIRDDQEATPVLGETIETPFSIKAAEDAKRFKEGEPAPVETSAAPETVAAKSPNETKPVASVSAAEAKTGEPVKTAAPEAKATEPAHAPTSEPAAAKKDEKSAGAKTKPPEHRLELKIPIPAPSVQKPEAKTEAPAKAPAPEVRTEAGKASAPEIPEAKKEEQSTEATPEKKPEIKIPMPAATAATPAPDKPVEQRSARNEAREVVEIASTLPGVASCAVSFTDGLSLAGNIPADTAVEGLSAVAPSLLQKIDRHMLDTKLGSLTSMTLHCAKTPITFFMKGSVCLTVLHQGGELTAETHGRLAQMTKDLSTTYSEPESAHVHH